MNILVTGSAGFIGRHLCDRLRKSGHSVWGMDISLTPRPEEICMDLARPVAESYLGEKLNKLGTEVVVHLAAQVGVRQSLHFPRYYVMSNLVGFIPVLEACRQHSIRHLLYASSSSVYGASVRTQQSVHDTTDHPISLYAATKRANELMAHSYSWLYNLPCTGLRFFTVYGPYCRPDMAIPQFTEAIRQGRPIRLYNNGNHLRDFTHVSDVVNGIIGYLDAPPVCDEGWLTRPEDPASSMAPFRIANIGSGRPIRLTALVRLIEEAMDKEATVEYLGLQPGDPVSTHADISDTIYDTGFHPTVPIEAGIQQYVEWHLSYYTEDRPFPIQPEATHPQKGV